MRLQFWVQEPNMMKGVTIQNGILNLKTWSPFLEKCNFPKQAGLFQRSANMAICYVTISLPVHTHQHIHYTLQYVIHSINSAESTATSQQHETSTAESAGEGSNVYTIEWGDDCVHMLPTTHCVYTNTIHPIHTCRRLMWPCITRDKH